MGLLGSVVVKKIRSFSVCTPQRAELGTSLPPQKDSGICTKLYHRRGDGEEGKSPRFRNEGEGCMRRGEGRSEGDVEDKSAAIIAANFLFFC